MPDRNRNNDGGEAEAQRRTDEAEDKGYLGTVPDETPNEAYSVAGVTSGTEAAEADREAATGGNGGSQDGNEGSGTGEAASGSGGTDTGPTSGQSNTGGQ